MNYSCLQNPLYKHTGGVERINHSRLQNLLYKNTGVEGMDYSCCGLVATWHMVPRHSRVPNVEEFGIVSRRLELGYKANHGFSFL